MEKKKEYIKPLFRLISVNLSSIITGSDPTIQMSDGSASGDYEGLSKEGPLDSWDIESTDGEE